MYICFIDSKLIIKSAGKRGGHARFLKSLIKVNTIEPLQVPVTSKCRDGLEAMQV